MRVFVINFFFGLFILTALSPATAASKPLVCTTPKGLPRSQILIFGEIHGTNEAPAFVGEQACALARDGSKVIVALEIPKSQQPRIDKYLDSSGSSNDQSDLLSGKFWLRKDQDGRSSVAMFKLIERARTIRNSGGQISVLAIDHTINNSRDEGMAASIRQAVASDKEVKVVALVGNYHSGNHKGTPWDSNYQPAGYLLRDLSPAIILIGGKKGSAWICVEKCGPIEMAGRSSDNCPAGYLKGQSAMPGHDGTYLLEATTASPPANSLLHEVDSSFKPAADRD